MAGSNSVLQSYGRVVDVILDSTHPMYDQYGKSQGINGVLYRELSKARVEDIGRELKFAYQGDSTFRRVPLKGELVRITTAPSEVRTFSVEAGKTYWDHITPLWNHPHHNAYPDVLQSKEPVADLGSDFEEKDNVNPLQLFPGDITFEGRHGQSIRFSGTSAKGNPWSSKSNNGKPFIIVRNGQATIDNGFDNVLEDINKDENSLYFFSDHIAPLIGASTKFNSFSIIPREVGTYKGNQVLLVANRLVFNAKKEDIIILADKNIALSSNIVGIDGKEYVSVDAKKIYLGERARQFEREPALLGATTEKWLEELLKQVEKISNTLATLPPAPQAAVGKLIVVGNSTKPILKTLKAKIRTLSSKKLFIE